MSFLVRSRFNDENLLLGEIENDVHIRPKKSYSFNQKTRSSFLRRRPLFLPTESPYHHKLLLNTTRINRAEKLAKPLSEPTSGVRLLRGDLYFLVRIDDEVVPELHGNKGRRSRARQTRELEESGR